MKGVSRIRKVLKVGMGLASMRSGDVLLASFPKSGNTWVRFFLGNLISIVHWNGMDVDYRVLDDTMPELGVSSLRARWPHAPVPRVVKTHYRYLPYFARFRSVFLSRNPLKVMRSYYRYDQSRVAPRFEGTLSEFIRSPVLGMPAWARHHKSWQSRAGHEMVYEDLKADPHIRLRKMLDYMQASFPDDVIAEAIARSDVRQVRRIEEKYGHSRSENFKDGFVFAGEGERAAENLPYSPKDLAFVRSSLLEAGLNMVVDRYEASLR